MEMPPQQGPWRSFESGRPIWKPVGTIGVVEDAPMERVTSQFSGIQLQQPRQQSRLNMLREFHRSRNNPGSEGEVAAVKFVNLVKSTLPWVEYHAFLQLMINHKRSLCSAGDVNAINLDTLGRVNELFQNNPVLIPSFRANFDNISALFASFALL